MTVAVPVGVMVGVLDGVGVLPGVRVAVLRATTSAVPVDSAPDVAATMVSTAPTGWVGSEATTGSAGTQASVTASAASK
ncbi:MAG: hypothetical protein COS37_08840 [Anaerolineae bacterium CG03_land_8_20_14_0_80_58_20]|nr:MAG: hypothetical protein COS37_08840 [Anaerolineae bacterium CG03_land_8_20_14_0_80_58_20]